MLTQSIVGSGSSKSSKAQSLPRIIPNRPGGAIEFLGIPKNFPCNAEIYGECEPANYLYKIVSGTVKTYRVRIDGRRQIGGFYLPGDIFGVEVGEEHAFSAEAISDCQVLLINRRAIMARAAREAAVARELWTLFGHEAERMQHHTLLLVKNAQERVASFLLEMAELVSEGNIIKLPMTRRDIADYLGLTIETVCRTFAHLEATATIEVHSHHQIVLRNRSALRRLNG